MDNQLYTTRGKGLNGVQVVRKGDEGAILHEAHSGSLGGHSGVNKTADCVKIRYWWPGFCEDIKNYIKLCEKCQKSDRLKPVQQPSLQHIQVKKPFELVGCDLMGPFHTTAREHKYIFTATDYFTKWVEAYPIKAKTASEVSSCLKKLLYRHGAVKAILTDQGREFVNQVNKDLCEEWNVSHRITAAYHPQTNGLDERTNQSIKRALSKYINSSQDDWDEHLDSVLFSLRVKPQATTKFSPFFLLYGREAVLPSQLPREFDVDDLPDMPSGAELEAFVEDFLEASTRTADVVQANVCAAQERHSRNFEARQPRPYVDFHEGDKVLQFNKRRADRPRKGDLGQNYKGPYIIEEIQNKCAKLVTIEGKPIKCLVSLDHLKHFAEHPSANTSNQHESSASASKSPTSASASKTSSSASARKPPSSASARKPPSSASASKPPSSASASKSPPSAAASKSPTSASASKPSSSASAGKSPPSAAASKSPTFASARKPPSSASAGKSPPSAATSKSPTFTSARKPPSSASAGKPPSFAAASKSPTFTSASKPPTSARKPSSSASASKPPSSAAASKSPTFASARKPPSSASASKPPSSASARKPPPSASASKSPTFVSASKPPSSASARKPPSSASASKPPSSASASKPSPSASASKPPSSASASKPPSSASASKPPSSASARKPPTFAASGKPLSSASASKPPPSAAAIETYIQELARDGSLDELTTFVQYMVLPLPNINSHTELGNSCPRYSLTDKIEADHEEELELMATSILAHVRSKPWNLQQKRHITVIAAAVCVLARHCSEPPMAMATTLLKRPTHLSPTDKRPHLTPGDKLHVAGEVLETDDLKSLSKGWINDKVINAFLNAQKLQKNKGEQHVLVLPSYLATLWLRGTFDHWLFTKVQFRQFQLILLPICHNDHWILLVAKPRQGVVSVFDSLNLQNDIYYRMWRSFMQAREKTTCENLHTWTEVDGQSSQQKDTSSCGVFVMMNAEAIIKEVPPSVMRQVHCCMYRRYVTAFLQKSGEERVPSCDYPQCANSGPSDRRCDCCGRSFHRRCAGERSQSTSFLCIFCRAMYA